MSRPDPLTRHPGVDPVRAARFLLLAWVACCDGELDGAERALLEELGGGLTTRRWPARGGWCAGA